MSFYTNYSTELDSVLLLLSSPLAALGVALPLFLFPAAAICHAGIAALLVDFPSKLNAFEVSLFGRLPPELDVTVLDEEGLDGFSFVEFRVCGSPGV